MHVILTPVGSSGDVNPFIVIGRELRRLLTGDGRGRRHCKSR